MLDNRYAGTTDAFTLVNGTFGVKWGSKRNIVTLLKATNLLNDEIQQHIFGDVSKLQVVGSCASGSRPITITKARRHEGAKILVGGRSAIRTLQY